MTRLDAKREAFAIEYLRGLAAGLPKGKAATAAARAAGYSGSSLSDNARRLPRHPAIKARLVELATPQQEAAEAELAITLDRAEARLWEIIFAKIDLNDVKAADVNASLRQLAAMRGWNAPTTVNVNKHVSTDWSTAELVAFVADATASLERIGAEAQGAREPGQVH